MLQSGRYSAERSRLVLVAPYVNVQVPNSTPTDSYPPSEALDFSSTCMFSELSPPGSVEAATIAVTLSAQP